MHEFAVRATSLINAVKFQKQTLTQAVLNHPRVLNSQLSCQEKNLPDVSRERHVIQKKYYFGGNSLFISELGFKLVTSTLPHKRRTLTQSSIAFLYIDA